LELQAQEVPLPVARTPGINIIISFFSIPTAGHNNVRPRQLIPYWRAFWAQDQLDGITNPKYKLFSFLTNITFLQKEEGTSF